jgi:hypothetical protein
MMLRDREGQRCGSYCLFETEESPLFLNQEDGTSFGAAHFHQGVKQGFEDLLVLRKRGQTRAVLDENLPPVMFGVTPKEHEGKLIREGHWDQLEK